VERKIKRELKTAEEKEVEKRDESAESTDQTKR
jgi:hypothetical protein